MAYKEVLLTCIRCPRGCQISVGLEGADIVSIEGQSCKRGEIYARSEVSNSVRTVTTTVPVVVGACERMVSVKTSIDVPKDKVMDVMQAAQSIVAHAPVSIGDVIARDIANTGADLIATESV